MRPLDKVLKAILKVVPEDQKELKVALESRLESVYYTAPEAMVGRWHEVVAILNEECPDINVEWQKTIAKIMSGQENYESHLTKEELEN